MNNCDLKEFNCNQQILQLFQGELCLVRVFEFHIFHHGLIAYPRNFFSLRLVRLRIWKLYFKEDFQLKHPVVH